MPSFAPRSEPAKKRGELENREAALLFAIKKNNSGAAVDTAVEKYKKARLSFIKARIHVFKEMEFQNKPTGIELKKLEDELAAWNAKTSAEIITCVMKSATRHRK